MSLAEVERAKREAVRARARLDSALLAVQEKLSPGNLAGEAWDGVKDKSAELADGALHAVKKRPGAVSLALGAFVLFLARDPLKRGIARLISGDGEEDATDGSESGDARLNAGEGVS